LATKSPKQRGIDQKFVHLVSSTIRLKALVVLVERTASPKQISVELREPLATVSHHVRELLNMGLIELVGEEPRRGAVEHYYRAIIRPIFSSEEWDQLSPSERQQVSMWVLGLSLVDAATSLDEGLFDARTDRHLSRVPLYVDEEGWRELVEIQSKALEASLDVQAASAERAANGESEGEGVHVSASMMCFEMPVPPNRRSS
jgi:DNA-binding transcriptional ArsR family regulator